VTGSAVETAGPAKETVALAAQPNGVFTGSGKFPATGNLQIDVTLTPPNEGALKSALLRSPVWPLKPVS
jgi:hypothetical protein